MTKATSNTGTKPDFTNNPVHILMRFSELPRENGVYFLGLIASDFLSLDQPITMGKQQKSTVGLVHNASRQIDIFSGVSLEVEVTMNEGKFHIWRGPEQKTGKFRLEPSNVTMFVTQYKPSSEYRSHLQARLEKEKALYHFQRK
jgi:hypothetical protein